MEFITSVVVMVPGSQLAQYQAMNSSIPITFLDENIVTGKHASTISTMDHQLRNYFLRNELIKQASVDEEFIMSDDDARPIRDIDFSEFKDNDRYCSYYFHDLSFWKYGSNPFDIGQQNTHQVLNQLGFPTLSYASHMPQIIDKGIFLEAGAFFNQYRERFSLCEWATYFNYSHKYYPEKFLPPARYITLCWPESPTCWPKIAQTNGYGFENYTPKLYGDGGPFQDMSMIANSEDVFMQKLILWHQYEIRSINGSWPEKNIIKKLIQFMRYCIYKLSLSDSLSTQSLLIDAKIRALLIAYEKDSQNDHK